MTKKHINVQDLMDIRVSSEAAGDIVRAIQEGGATGRYAAGEDIPANRLVDLDAGEVKMGVGDGKVFGASIAPIDNGEKGVIQTEGPVFIDAATDFSKGDLVACGPGGYAGVSQVDFLFLGGSISSGIAGADVDDDLVQTNLPDIIQAVCAGDETGNKMVVYGLVGTGFVKEEVDLGPAATYETTNTFNVVYCVEFTQQTVSTIDVQTKTGPDALIPTQIAGTTAARMYGAIEPNTSNDPKGLGVVISALAATNNGDVVLMGTGPDGNEQFETITMNDDTLVDSVNSWRTLDYVLIGADGLVWNAGSESEYYWVVERTLPRGKAVDDLVGAGQVEVELDRELHGIQEVAPRVYSAFREPSVWAGKFMRTDGFKDNYLTSAQHYTEGVFEGMFAIPPTTPSSQLTGAGGVTEWRVDVTSGLAIGYYPNLEEKYFAAETDLVIHDTTNLLQTGECVTAALVVEFSGGAPSFNVVKGPVIASDYSTNEIDIKLAAYNKTLYDPALARDWQAQRQNTDDLAVAQIGSKHVFGDPLDSYALNWCWVALLVLERTADTTVVQREINQCRDMSKGSFYHTAIHRAIEIAVLEAHERAAKLLGITL